MSRGQNESTHQIVMAFSPLVVGRLLEDVKEAGGMGSNGLPGTPLATPLLNTGNTNKGIDGKLQVTV